MKRLKTSIRFLPFYLNINKDVGKLLLLLCLLISERQVLSAQSGKVAYKISYDVTTSDSKKPKRGEKSYSTIEKLDMVKKIQEQDHVEIIVYDDGSEKTIINHISSNKYPNDMIAKPARTEIDDKGVKMYDSRGKVLANVEHSPMAREFLQEGKKNNQAKKKFQIAEIKAMSKSDLSELTANGVRVKQTKEGKMHMKKDNREMLYDSNNQETEEREFEGKELRSISKKKFSKTRDNITFVSESTDITMINNESGRKMYQFVNKSIKNYQVDQGLGTRGDEDSNKDFIKAEDKIFSIQPNPATEDIWIQIPLSTDGKSVNFVILDMNGKIMLNEKIQRGLKQLSVKELPEGIYIAQFSSEEGDKQTLRFVKQ